MGLKRRQFSWEFKLQIIREIDSGKPQAQIARQDQINQNTISQWRRQYRRYQDRAFSGNGKSYTDEARIGELERMVGRLTMESDLLKKVLRRYDGQAPST